MNTGQQPSQGVRLLRALLLSLAIWTVLAVPAVFQGVYQERTQDPLAPVWPTLLFSVTSYWIFALLTVPVFVLARKFPVHRRPYWKALLVHGASFFVMMLLIALVRPVQFSFLHIATGGLDMSFRAVLYRMFHLTVVQWVWMYWMMLLAAHAVQYYRDIKHRELQEAELRAQLSQNELQLLKLQLHPHFLFNSLNGISALMSTDVPRARSMVAQLSDLLRAALKRADDEIALEDELRFVDSYVDLQKMRLGDRLTFEKHIAPEVAGALVPNMVVQPLVENAVKHGIENSRDKGRIVLEIGRDGSRIKVAVSNDARTADMTSATRGTGVGLSTLQARLAAIYGSDQSLALERDNGRVVATLEFPLRKTKNKES